MTTTHRRTGQAILTLTSFTLVVALGAGSRAAAAPPEPVRSLTLPGTPAALGASLGLDTAAIERPRYMLELVHHVWGWNGGLQNPLAFDRLVLEVKGLQRLQQAWFEARARDNAVGLEDARSNRKVRSLLRTLGLALMEDTRERRLAVVVDDSPAGVQARDAIAAAGFDSHGVAASLNRGNRLRFSLPTFTVPLPLQPSVWMRHILQKSVEPEWLFAAILADREASLLYRGLLSLDRETLTFFADQPRLVEVLAREHAPAFGVYGRSIHVREGRVMVPGGEVPEVVKLWEELVGRKVTEPAAFIDRLLRAADGRLAYLYDVIQHLDRPHQLFALGARPPSPAPPYSRELFEQVADALAQPDFHLDIKERPFRRPAIDLFIVLSSVAVSPDGQLVPPLDPALWARLFEGVDRGRPLTAGAVARLVLRPDHLERPLRLRTFLFAQRVFGGSPPEEGPELVEALAGYGRFPLLYAVLERMGVRKPSTYSAATARAERLSNLRDTDVARDSISQFQGAIAILDRCVFSGRLDAATAARLLDRLLDVPAAPDGSYTGGLAGWLGSELLPSLDPDATRKTEDRRDRERTLLKALAGVPAAPRPLALFTWKDAEYHFDPGEADYKRLEAIRQKQGGPSLDRLLDLAALGAGLRSPQRTAASGREALAALIDLAEGLVVPPALAAISRRTPGAGALSALAKRQLQDLQKGTDVRRLDDVAEEAERLAEFLLAAAVRSIVYAVHLDPETPMLLEGDMSVAHDFGSSLPSEQRQSVAWRLAEGGGVPWRARGSVLALDQAFWGLSLQMLSNEPPTGRQSMIEEDRIALGQAARLFNPYLVADDDARVIAQAVERGRRRVEAALENGATLEALGAEAGLGEPIANTLCWAVEFDREAARHAFALSHLLRLGRGSTDAPPAAPVSTLADRWGAFRGPLTGELRLTEPPSTSWDSYAGRANTAYLSMHLGEMQLHVALWLAQTKLPAALARDILPAAMQDLRDGARLAHWNDWRAAVRYAVEYPENRFSDLVSALADRGVLALSSRQ